MLTGWIVNRAFLYSAVSKPTFTCAVDGAVLYHLIRIPTYGFIGWDLICAYLPNFHVLSELWADSRVGIGNEVYCLLN